MNLKIIQSWMRKMLQWTSFLAWIMQDIYGDFKVDTMNCMTSKSMEPAENLNPVKVVKSLNGLRILLIKFQTDLKFQRVRADVVLMHVLYCIVLYCIVLYWGA